MASTDAATRVGGSESKEERLARIQKSLRSRRAAETRFRAYGIGAVAIAVGFVLFLFGSILHDGLPAFWQPTIDLKVHFN